jgi:uncharacterized membrane protein
MRIAVIIGCLLMLVNAAFAAHISGTVYDYTLDPAKGAIVTVNSTPRQQAIAANSSYEFNLPPGRYVLSAKLFEDNRLVAESEEELHVSGEGDFTLDIILFPAMEDEALYHDLEFNFSFDDTVPVPEQSPKKGFVWPWSIAGFVVFAIVAFYYARHRKTARITARSDAAQEVTLPTEAVHDETYASVLAVIRTHRRITQKEIRKEVPMSEAKISLVIAELEEKGIVQKIKKGRGNIILLK